MKTKLLVIAGIAAILIPCQYTQAQFKYGLHAGLNLETQAEFGQLWNNNEILPGFMVGGFLEYNVMKKISLQTELDYQRKGLKYETSADGSKSYVNKEFNYMTIPVLIKGNISSGSELNNKFNITGFTGPYFGFLTSAISDVKSGDITTETNIDKQADKNDWGLIFGIGLEHNLNNGGAIVTEMRYEMGLNKVDKIDADLRNKVFGISIGYRF